MERDRSRFAETLADRIADLLSAPVRVVDDAGAVLARTPSAEAEDAGEGGASSETEYLRVHTEAHGQRICIIVGEPQSPEHMPRSVAYTIIDLVLKQRMSLAEVESAYDERNAFLAQILTEPQGDERQMIRRARKLQVDIERPRVVMLISAAEYLSMPGLSTQRYADRRVRRRVQFLIDAVARFFPPTEEPLVGHLGEGNIALLKSFASLDLREWSSPSDALVRGESWANLKAAQRCADGLYERLKAELKAPFMITVGRFYGGITGLAQSYRDALITMQVAGELHEIGRAQSIVALQIDAYAWLRDDYLKVDLAHQLLNPVSRDRDLYETLSVFFNENCSLVSAAHRLSLHRNTLSYRLDKIASLTGLDPRCLDDAAQLRMAMLVSTRRRPETLRLLAEQTLPRDA